MFVTLPAELVCNVLRRLGACDLRHVLGVCRDARTHVIEAIYDVALARQWVGAIDDYTPHGLLGMEMAEALRTLLQHAPERVDALANCVEFQMYRPTLGQLHDDRGSVVWHDDDGVEVGPASRFRDEVDTTFEGSTPHAGWDEQLLVDVATVEVASRGDVGGFVRVTDMRPSLLHARTAPRLSRVYTKVLHEPTEGLHACMVHVRSAALFASLACDLDGRAG